MHKGIILLVKANSKENAEHKVTQFMEPHGDGQVWDWYVIGGRWNELYSPTNLILAEDLLEKFETDFPPFALVEPDSTWNEKGKMGWWAVVRDESAPDDWALQAEEVLRRHPGKFVVTVDCHI